MASPVCKIYTVHSIKYQPMGKPNFARMVEFIGLLWVAPLNYYTFLKISPYPKLLGYKIRLK